MNKKLKIALVAFAAVVVLIIGAVIIASVARSGQEEAPESAPPAEVSAQPSGTSTEPPAATPTPEHVNTVSSTLAVGGDIVMHTGLNAEAQTATAAMTTRPIFGVLGQLYLPGGLCRLLAGHHASAGSGPYTAYPLFTLAGLPGLLHRRRGLRPGEYRHQPRRGLLQGRHRPPRLDALESARARPTSAPTAARRRAAAGNYTVADVDGVSVAFLSYTCDTNDIPVAGFEYAVSICTADYLGDGQDGGLRAHAAPTWRLPRARPRTSCSSS